MIRMITGIAVIDPAGFILIALAVGDKLRGDILGLLACKRREPAGALPAPVGEWQRRMRQPCAREYRCDRPIHPAPAAPGRSPCSWSGRRSRAAISARSWLDLPSSWPAIVGYPGERRREYPELFERYFSPWPAAWESLGTRCYHLDRGTPRRRLPAPCPQRRRRPGATSAGKTGLAPSQCKGRTELRLFQLSVPD